MKDIWFISGMGADERAFQRLDFSGWQPHFVDWIEPVNHNETIEGYAKRLLDQIKDDHPIIVGYSFGGMMAIEISRLIDTEQIVLLSSSKNRQELPPHYRLAGHLPIYRLIPLSLVKKAKWFYNWSFGAQKPEDKKLLYDIIQDSNKKYLYWAMKVITQWQNREYPKDIIHIHGTADRVLPFKYVAADYPIKGGSHLMVINRHKEISKLLHQVID